MATIDEELAQLERDIRQLKIEYDQYFGGGRKRPPTEIEWRIELVVKRYAERGGELKYGHRFRLNNLTRPTSSTKTFSARKPSRRKKERFSATSAPPPKPSKRNANALTNMLRSQSRRPWPLRLAQQPAPFA